MLIIETREEEIVRHETAIECLNRMFCKNRPEWNAAIKADIEKRKQKLKQLKKSYLFE